MLSLSNITMNLTGIKNTLDMLSVSGEKNIYYLYGIYHIIGQTLKELETIQAQINEIQKDSDDNK